MNIKTILTSAVAAAVLVPSVVFADTPPSGCRLLGLDLVNKSNQDLYVNLPGTQDFVLLGGGTVSQWTIDGWYGATVTTHVGSPDGPSSKVAFKVRELPDDMCGTRVMKKSDLPGIDTRVYHNASTSSTNHHTLSIFYDNN